jgi:hypothetical protein
MTAEQPIVLPADTIEVDVPNLGSFWGSGIDINRTKGTGRLTVSGTDRNLSRIKCGPDSPAYEYALFISKPDTYLYLNDLTIEGPPNPGGSGANVPNTAAVSQIGYYQTPSGIDVNHVGEVRLTRVTISGEFNTSIQGNHGDTLLDLIDSDITGYINCVSWYGALNTNKRLHATNTYFHDAGFTDSSGPRGHLVYCHPNVSIDFQNCRFSRAMRSSIHHYGNSSLSPQYARVIGCVFDSTCLYGVETTNTGSTLIMGCTFNVMNVGVTAKKHVDVVDCTFQCSTGIGFSEGGSNLRLDVTGCRFYTPAGAISFRQDASNGEYRISDCLFQSDLNSTIMIAGGTGADGTRQASSVWLDNCTFGGAGAYRAIAAQRGNFYISNCRFSGPLHAVQQNDDYGLLGRIEVTGCNFENTGQSAWAYSGGPGKMFGQNNYFGSNARQPEANLSVSGMFGRVSPRTQTSPNSLASVSNLCLHFNYNAWRVTGTTRINYITVGCSDATNRMASGPVVLIADGTWSLGDTGNIRPLSTAARPIGSSVTLVHDPQTDIWSETSSAPPPVPAPTVTAISPTTGSTSGGASVTVTGTGFLAGARLSLGGSPATSVAVVSSTSLTAVTPAHSEGAVDVVVTNSDGQAGTLRGGYTFVAPAPPPPAAPTVTAISPSSGSTSGGASVTVTGTGFQAGARLSLGGSPATSVTVVSSTSLSAVTPAHSEGAVDIVVTNSDGQAGTLRGGYTYVAPDPPPPPAPTVTAISPSSGSTSGGGSVTVTGAGFQAGARLSLGGSPATSVTVVSSTSLTAVTPAHSEGVVDVVVTNSDGLAGVLRGGYTYVAPAPAPDTTPPTVAFNSPTPGSQVWGMVSVVVAGADNVGVASVTVTVDGAVLESRTVSPYSFSWDTTTVAAGTHTLGATARDAAGNVSSTSISVVVTSPPDTTPPSITITSPLNGAKVKKAVTVTVSAFDNVAVRRVELYVDGKLKATSTAAPFSMKWNAKTEKVGTYTLQCKAYDAAGNMGASTTITVYKR